MPPSIIYFIYMIFTALLRKKVVGIPWTEVGLMGTRPATIGSMQS